MSKNPREYSMTQSVFGVDDGSYQSAGGLEGITALVDDFYYFMDTLPEAKQLRAMHEKDLTLSAQKLTYFLSGWLGGPKLYSATFGDIKIPVAHKHLKATVKDGEAWLLCMQYALEQQHYSSEFKAYLMAQLKVPTNRIIAAGGQQGCIP